MGTVSKTEIWIGSLTILATGLIHLALARGEAEEALYLGLLFVAHGVLAAIAAIGIYRGARAWGWGLGLLLAVGAIVGYVISRTVGLPGMEVEEWLQPIGILALVLEAAFVVLFFRTVSTRPQVGMTAKQ
jgi:hypothetical protein